MQDININLIEPIPAYQQEQRIRWFLCSISICIAVLIALVGITCFQGMRMFHTYTQEEKIRTDLQHHTSSMQALNNTRQLETTLKQFDQAIKQMPGPLSPVTLLKQLADTIPSDIFIQRFEYSLSKKNIFLEGISFSFPSIHTFVEEVSELPVIATCTLISLAQEKSSFKNAESMIRFTLDIAFN